MTLSIVDAPWLLAHFALPIAVPVGIALIILSSGIRHRKQRGQEPSTSQQLPAQASGPALHLVAESGQGEDPADDVIDPSHPLYPMMMEAMSGNIVTADRNEDGTVTITGSKPLQ